MGQKIENKEAVIEVRSEKRINGPKPSIGIKFEGGEFWWSIFDRALWDMARPGNKVKWSGKVSTSADGQYTNRSINFLKILERAAESPVKNGTTSMSPAGAAKAAAFGAGAGRYTEAERAELTAQAALNNAREVCIALIEKMSDTPKLDQLAGMADTFGALGVGIAEHFVRFIDKHSREQAAKSETNPETNPESDSNYSDPVDFGLDGQEIPF